MDYQGNTNMSVCGPSGYPPSGGQTQMTSAGSSRMPSGPNGGMSHGMSMPSSNPYANQDYPQQYRQYNSYSSNYPPQDYGQQQGSNGRFPQVQINTSQSYSPGQSGHGHSPTLNQLLMQTSSNQQSRNPPNMAPMPVGPNNYRPYEGGSQYQGWNQGKPSHMHSGIPQNIPTSNSAQDPSQAQSYGSTPIFDNRSTVPGPYNQHHPAGPYPGYPQTSRYNDPYARGPPVHYPPGQPPEGPPPQPYPASSEDQQQPPPPSSQSSSRPSQPNTPQSQQSGPDTTSQLGPPPPVPPQTPDMMGGWPQQHPGYITSQHQPQHQPITEPVSPDSVDRTVEESSEPRPHSRVSESGRASNAGSSKGADQSGYRNSPAPPSCVTTPHHSGGGGSRSSPMPPRPPSSSHSEGAGDTPSQPPLGQAMYSSGGGPPPPPPQQVMQPQMHPGYNMMGQHRGPPPGPGRNMMPPSHPQMGYPPHPGGKPVPPYPPGYVRPPMPPPQTPASTGSSYMMPPSGPPPPPGYHHQQSGYGPYPGPHSMYGPPPGQQPSVAGMEQFRGSPSGPGRPCPPNSSPMRPQLGPGPYPGPPGGQPYPMMPMQQHSHGMNGPNHGPLPQSGGHNMQPMMDMTSKKECEGPTDPLMSGLMPPHQMSKMKGPGTPKSESSLPVASPSQNSLSSYHDELESMMSSPGLSAGGGGMSAAQTGSSVTSSGSLQKLYEMGNEPERRGWIERYLSFMEEIGKGLGGLPQVAKQALDLYRFYLAVRERGGLMEVVKTKRWKEISQFVNINASASAAYTLRKNYVKYLLDYECRMDRGGIDPRPLIQQIEAMTGKKKKKPSSSMNQSERMSVPTPPQGANEFCMDYPPPHYLQNGQAPRGFPPPPPAPYTNGHGSMLPPRGSPYGPQQPGWRPPGYPPQSPSQQQNGVPPSSVCYPNHQMPSTTHHTSTKRRAASGSHLHSSNRSTTSSGKQRSDALIQMLASSEPPSRRPDWSTSSSNQNCLTPPPPQMPQQLPARGGVPPNLFPSSSAGGMPPPAAPPPHIGGPGGGGVRIQASGPSLPMRGGPPGMMAQQIPPHPELMQARMTQKSNYVTAVFKRMDHTYFPPNSVEASQPILSKRKKYTHKDVCPLVPWKLYMALKSGLPAEVSWALDALNILLRDEVTFQYFGLSHLPGLLEALVETWRHSLSEVFGTSEFTEVMELDKELCITADQDMQGGQTHSDKGTSMESELWERLSGNGGEYGMNGIRGDLREILKRNRNFPSRSRQGLLVKLEKRSNGPHSFVNQKELIMFLIEEAERRGHSPERKKEVEPVSNLQNLWLAGGGDTTCHIQSPLESKAPHCLHRLFFSRRRRHSEDDYSEGEEPPIKCLRVDTTKVRLKATEEMCLDGEATLHQVSNQQESRALRCLCVGTVLRNLSFLSANEREMVTNRGLLALIGRLLVRGHEHHNDWPPDSTAQWWRPWIELMRESGLVLLANLSGQLQLSSLPEILVRPLLSGSLHWLTCNSAASVDPFPGQLVLSPRRLALEAITKLCVHEDNLELVLATPSSSQLERLFTNLAEMIASPDHVLREMSLACLNYLSRGGEGLGALLLARAKPCAISSLIDFLECAEASARRVIDNMGMEALQAKPELMGTSLELVRRVGGMLERLAAVEANLSLFSGEHQNRLLTLVMSKVLDQNVAQSVAGVLYRLPVVMATGPPATLPAISNP